MDTFTTENMKHIRDIFTEKTGVELPGTKRTQRPVRTALLIAAAVVLVLGLGVAAYAVYNNSLQEMVIREAPPAETETAVSAAAETPVESPEGWDGPSSHWDPLADDGRDFISLQGYADSPEYQAMQEWMQFIHTYDTDGAVMKSIGNKGIPEIIERYAKRGYYVYSWEMADKLEEIIAKYGLSLHDFGGSGDMDAIRAEFGDFTTAENWSGYWYADGTFQFDGQNGIEGYGIVDYQFRRVMKGSFDDVGTNIGDADSYEQWTYKTACGETVLLALGPYKALIFADLDDCFVAVNVLSGAETPDVETEFGSGPLSAEYLEALADTFDFTVL